MLKINLFLFIFCFCSLIFQVRGQSNVQIPAELERNEGVLLVWDYYPARDSVVANIAGAVQDHAIVWIIYYPGTVPYDTTYIRNYLLSRGVGYHNVHFLPAWTNTLWIRDFGPVTGYQANQTDPRRLFDLGYSDYNRPRDDSIPSQLANYWNMPLFSVPLQVEGGNLIFDGFIRAFGSKRILDQNAPMSPEQIGNILKQQFNLTDFVFLDKLLNSGGGIWMHVDMYMKMIDHETIMISEYPSYLPDYPIIENIADQISNLNSIFGRPYQVIRIPAPPKANGTYATTLNDEMRTYTNALTINDVVVVPSYNLPMDTLARQIYEQAMPGYTIKMVDARVLTPAYGAIHCITREIPAPDMLRIKHAKLSGLQPYETHKSVFCEVTGSITVDSVFLYFRLHADTIVKKIVMLPSCTGFMGVIPNLEIWHTVSYFITAYAQDQCVSAPAMAPQSSFMFWFDTSVTNLSVTNVTATSAQLSWLPAGNEEHWDVLWGEVGFDPQTQGNLIEGITTFAYYLSGLNPATNYEFYVRAVFPDAYTGPWSGPAGFTTLNNIFIGDANCDGQVNVLDVVVIVSFITGSNPDPFCFVNADVNMDNLINVLDVIGTVNIVLGGDKNFYANISRKGASIYLNHEGIELDSEGNIAGLQFEVCGLHPGEMTFMLPGYEFAGSFEKDKFIGVIFSFSNSPLPAGRIRLIHFKDVYTDKKWGNVIAGNPDAMDIQVTKHQFGFSSDLERSYTVNAHPNPVKEQLYIEIENPVISSASIIFSDVTGRMVRSVHTGTLSTGDYHFSVDLNNSLLPGLYLLNVRFVPESSQFQEVNRYMKIIVAE